MKYKKYPQYKDSGVEWLGKIPKEWNISKIKHLFNLGRGRVIAVGELEEEGIYPVYSSQTKNNGILGLIETYDYNCRQITWTTDGANAGTVFLREGKHNCTNVCGTLQARNDRDLLEYMTYSLQFSTQFYKRPDTNGAKIMNGEMAEIFTPRPPLQEQQTIANYLDKATAKIDTLIEKQTKLIELLKEKRQAVISTAVTRGLDSSVPMKDSGVEWLGDIPEHWTRTPLRYIGRLQNGISKGGDYFGSGFPFVNYGDIYKNATLPQKVSGLAKSTKEDQHIYSVKVGDVFFTRTSETIDDIGMASTCIETIEKGTFSGFTIRFRQLTQILDEYFSKYYFRTGHAQAFFEEQLNLVTRASLGQDILKQLPVLIPPIHEQKEIAQVLDIKTTRIDTLVLKATRSIELLKEKRTALISAIVTGKIDVRDIT